MARTPTDEGFVLYDCPVARFQHLASGKHKLRIIWDLRHGPLRYGELKKALLLGLNGQRISPRILSRELKALTTLGLVARKDYGTVPPKVEYRLTRLGHSLTPLIENISSWGVRYFPPHKIRNLMPSHARRQMSAP